MELFWERGFQGTSMKDLEHGLDMRPGSLYAAFGNKEALFMEAVSLYARRLETTFQETVYQDDLLLGLQRFLENIVDANSGSGIGRSCLLVKTLMEGGGLTAPIREACEGFLNNMENVFYDFFRACRKQKNLPAGVDCRRLARYMQLQIMGLQVIALRAGPDLRARRLLVSDIMTGLAAVSGGL